MSLRTHLHLARASNLPTAWSNVLCAFLLAGGLDWPVFIGAIVAVSFFYIGGMYLNDWKDAEFDEKHRPERPIPSKQISRPAVLFCSVLFFIAALAISLQVQPGSILWALGLLACIALYDLNHKENSLSPWVMAGCRALIYPWAASLSGQVFPVELWIACGAAYAYTLGLTYIARGPGKTVSLKILLSGCVFLPALLWGVRLNGPSVLFGILSLIGFLAWTGYSLRGWLAQPPRIGFTVRNLIAGFFLVDLLALSASGPVPGPILLLLAVLFIATLKIQTIISGT